MPQMQFGFDNGIATPKKILDTGGKWARVYLQLLDANTVFIEATRDTLLQSGSVAQPIQGLQLKNIAGQPLTIFAFWWKGPMWGIGSVNGTLIDYVIVFADDGGANDGLVVAAMGDD
jgi:hypothetical protein